MRTYAAIENIGSAFLNWPRNTIRHALRTDGTTCGNLETWFNGLSPTEQLTASSLAVPANLPGKRWIASDCGGYPTFVEVDDTEYFDNQTPPPMNSTYNGTIGGYYES